MPPPPRNVKDHVIRKDIHKVKFEKFELKTPAVLPVKDQIFGLPVLITNINTKNVTNKNWTNNNIINDKVTIHDEIKSLRTPFVSFNHIGRSEIERRMRNRFTSPIITNIRPVLTRYTMIDTTTFSWEKEYVSGKKKYRRILFPYADGRRGSQYIEFITFIKAYPSVKFLIDYYNYTRPTNAEIDNPPGIIDDIINFIKDKNNNNLSEKIKLNDLKGLFKIFLFKDICIFKILGEIKDTQYTEIKTFLKTKIKKYINNPNSMNMNIWVNLDFTEVKNHPIFGVFRRDRLIWTVLEKSGVFNYKQMSSIINHYKINNRTRPERNSNLNVMKRIFSNYKRRQREKEFQEFLKTKYGNLPNNMLRKIKEKLMKEPNNK